MIFGSNPGLGTLAKNKAVKLVGTNENLCESSVLVRLRFTCLVGGKAQ